MHENSGNCQSCLKIFDIYPGFYPPLKGWFLALQLKVPEAHISSAGRGKLDQEVFFQRGATKAHYGQSAHNFNCAIDLFALINNKAQWPISWFQMKIAPQLNDSLEWYGKPGSYFYELPHIEVIGWKHLGSLVEPF